VDRLGICLAKILVIFFFKKLNLFKFCSKILEILEKSHLSVGAEFFFLPVEKTMHRLCVLNTTTHQQQMREGRGG